MNMKRLLNQRVVKQTVKDLKDALKDAPDDAEVVLCFNWKDGEDKVVYGYLAEVFSRLDYDGVIKERMENNVVVELDCYNDEFCTYLERKQ